MQQKTITVLIDENGNSSVDLDGFAGQGCEKVLREFQGKDRTKVERRKATYYGEARVAHEKLQRLGGQ